MQDGLKPIDVDDHAIAAALKEAHIPSLMAAMVHITGDAAPVRGDIRPVSQMFGDPQGGISETDQAAVRDRALEVLTAYRDAGCPPLAPIAPEVVKEMVDFIVGSTLDARYGDFLMSELKLFDEDPYRVPFDDVPVDARADFHVLVVGAGMSGILAAIKLRQAGIAYTVVDKNANVGGTWFENRYPGCRVDSPNHTYSYSFAPNDWPQHFSRQDVLLGYFDRIATEFGIRDNIRLETEVLEARYQADGTWAVIVRNPDGNEETIEANAIVTAVGQLNRPKFPAVDGVGSFRGPAFHTAQWESEHDLEGKRIVVIGTGASAFQTVPEIARTAKQVTVFQRTPPWVAPRPEYHDYISDAKHWLLNHVPFYAKWFRFHMFWQTGEGLLGMVKRDPAWNETDRSISEANDQLRSMLTANVQQMVGDDPELFEKCVPDYPPAGKRMLVDNGHWVPGVEARQRRTGHRPDLPDRRGRGGHRIRAACRCGCAHLRHGLLRQPHSLPDAHLRCRRRGAAGPLGGGPPRLPRPSSCPATRISSAATAPTRTSSSTAASSSSRNARCTTSWAASSS